MFSLYFLISSKITYWSIAFVLKKTKNDIFQTIFQKPLHCSLKSNYKDIFSPFPTNLRLAEKSIFDWISSLQEFNGGRCLFSTYYTDPGFKLPGSIQRMCLTRRYFHEKTNLLLSKVCFKLCLKDNIFFFCLFDTYKSTLIVKHCCVLL